MENAEVAVNAGAAVVSAMVGLSTWPLGTTDVYWLLEVVMVLCDCLDSELAVGSRICSRLGPSRANSSTFSTTLAGTSSLKRALVCAGFECIVLFRVVSQPSSFRRRQLEVPEGTLVLTYRLDPETIIRSAQDDTAGAIAMFIGTTRNSFQGAFDNFFVSSEPSRWLFRIPGQTVARLEYQAYSNGDKDDGGHLLPAHANATQSEHSALSGPPVSPLLHYAVHRRLEMMPLGGASVVTAVSLPHRKGAFVAREYILEHIKLDAPI